LLIVNNISQIKDSFFKRNAYFLSGLATGMIEKEQKILILTVHNWVLSRVRIWKRPVF
jgi:hypothetical protein